MIRYWLRYKSSKHEANRPQRANGSEQRRNNNWVLRALSASLGTLVETTPEYSRVLSFYNTHCLQHKAVTNNTIMPNHRRVSSAVGGEEIMAHHDEMGGKIRRCTYNDRNHLSVLTQCYGSVWPKVLRFCIINMAITLLVFYTCQKIDWLTIDPAGHRCMALILSFLVVTRCKIAVARYMESMGYLTDCYTSCRDLIHYTCVLTQQDTSEGATVWRHNVAYRTIILLRVTMSAIEYESQKHMPWEIPELSMMDEQDIRRASMSTTPRHYNSQQDECFRAPVLLAYALRKEIMEQRTGAFLKEPFRHVNEELKLQDCVTDFMKGKKIFIYSCVAALGTNSLVPLSSSSFTLFTTAIHCYHSIPWITEID